VCVGVPPPGPLRLPILGFRALLGGIWSARPGPATLLLWVVCLSDGGSCPLVGYWARTGGLAGRRGQVANLVLGRVTASRRVAPPEIDPCTRKGSASGGENCPSLVRKGGGPDANHDGFACPLNNCPLTGRDQSGLPRGALN
jgi:hypothetical protein